MKVRALIQGLVTCDPDAEISIDTTDNRLPWVSVERLDVTLRDKVVLVPTAELARLSDFERLESELEEYQNSEERD